MRYGYYDIVMQEVPHEISLLIHITGCEIKCDGCHSVEFHDPNFGTELTINHYKELLAKYNKFITCVLFYGGEWEEDELVERLKIAKNMGKKTCLYTGRNHASKSVTSNLDYLKTGPYKKELGGLECPTTNQKFINLTNSMDMGPWFRRKSYASSQR